jgi:hypothetical protein
VFLFIGALNVIQYNVSPLFRWRICDREWIYCYILGRSLQYNIRILHRVLRLGQCIGLCACLPACLPVCLPVCLSACLSASFTKSSLPIICLAPVIPHLHMYQANTTTPMLYQTICICLGLPPYLPSFSRTSDSHPHPIPAAMRFVLLSCGTAFSENEHEHEVW